jgi:hypothetical protein
MRIENQPTLTLHKGDLFLMPPPTPPSALDLGAGTGVMLSSYIVEVGVPLAEFTAQRPHGGDTPGGESRLGASEWDETSWAEA